MPPVNPAQMLLGSPSLPPARSPLGQRLSGALQARVTKSRGRLDRLELLLVHTLAAGAGWSTDWRVRAAIECVTRPARARASVGAAAVVPESVVSRTADAAEATLALSIAQRTIDRGALPPGPALDELWRWVVDTASTLNLPAPSLTERVEFGDAAPAASLDVLRHRVLRSAAVLERLPVSVEVKLGQRKDAADSRAPVVRLVARFPEREGSRGDTRVVLWSDDRDPALVTLLRDCARRLDPRRAMQPRPAAEPR